MNDTETTRRLIAGAPQKGFRANIHERAETAEGVTVNVVASVYRKDLLPLFAGAADLAVALDWLIGLHDQKPADFDEQLPLVLAAGRMTLAKAARPLPMRPVRDTLQALRELTIAAEAAGWDTDPDNAPLLDEARAALATLATVESEAAAPIPLNKLHAFVDRLAQLITPADDIEDEVERDNARCDIENDTAFEEAMLLYRLIEEARELRAEAGTLTAETGKVRVWWLTTESRAGIETQLFDTRSGQLARIEAFARQCDPDERFRQSNVEAWLVDALEPAECYATWGDYDVPVPPHASPDTSSIVEAA